jgi:hypothetical protein
LAAAVRQEPDVAVELVDGKQGELTVLVDGRVVAQKGLFTTLSAETVLAAVRNAMPTGANV